MAVLIITWRQTMTLIFKRVFLVIFCVLFLTGNAFGVNRLYNNYKDELHRGNIDWSSDTFKIVLVDSGYTFDATDDVYGDVSGDELSTANGYTQDTKTLANITLTQDNADGVWELTFDDVTWTASGGSIGPAQAAIIYDDTHGSDTLVGYIHFNGTKTATNGNLFTVEDGSIK